LPRNTFMCPPPESPRAGHAESLRATVAASTARSRAALPGVPALRDRLRVGVHRLVSALQYDSPAVRRTADHLAALQRRQRSFRAPVTQRQPGRRDHRRAHSRGRIAMTASPRPELDADTLERVHALFALVRAGDADTLARLLHMGLVPNLRDAKGDSLLMLAAYHGHTDAVRLLLQHGADPELANDRRQTPPAAVAFKGDLQLARVLLDHGARVDTHPEGGRTALM